MKPIRLRVFGEAVIEVGDAQVTPASSHIFALLLMLTLGPKEGWTRRELMEMLFEGVEAKEASHRLRQLLYKLRGFGVDLHEERSGLLRVKNEVLRPEELIADGAAVHESLQTQHADWVLPRYTAPAIAPLQEWVEELRDRLAHDLRTLLSRALRESHQAVDWGATSRLGRILLARDPFNIEALAMTAEALAGSGSIDDALGLLDNFLAHAGAEDGAGHEIRRLRARFAKLKPSGTRAPLRGRDVQISRLLRRLRSSDPREGSLTVVEGAAGIGKTHLAQALHDNMAPLGTPVIRFNCNEHTQHIPLAPFVEVAGRLQNMRGALGASPEFREILQRITNRSSDSAWPTDEFEIVERRLSIQIALTDLIQSVTSETPTVLIVDDAHLLDEASLDLIRTLAEGTHTPSFHVALFLRSQSHLLEYLARVSNILIINLPPLADDACRQILRDIPDHRLRSESAITDTLAQSAGNPFYLKLLAKHEHSSGAHPFELQSLADTTFARLDDDARIVLETCLLLDSVATIPRLEQISGISGRPLIAALRKLEADALLRLEEGRLIGPHALLHSALRRSIPTAICGVLRRRIAFALTAECLGNSSDPFLALAAIQHWLEVHDGPSALALARKSARHAVSLGEPSTAVLLLDSIPRPALATEDQKALLDEIINLADHARHHHVLLSALRERITLAESLGENASGTANLQLRLFHAEHTTGVAYPGPLERVRAIASDSCLQVGVRIRAVVWLLTIAFLEYDVALAEKAYNQLSRVPLDENDASVSLLRACANLVYHTAFGSREIALGLISELIASHPIPTTDRNTQTARKYAGFAAIRLGVRDVARRVFAEDLAFGEDKAAFALAEYAAEILADIAIGDGDYLAAESYLKRLEQIGKRRREGHTYIAAYFSSAACIAIRRREFDKAVDLLREVKQSHAIVGAPRQRAITLGLEMRIAAYRGDSTVIKEGYEELRSLFARGCMTGGQDVPAEAMWRCEYLINGPRSASALLREYLESQRREFGHVEQDLWLETKCDELWSEPHYAKLITAPVPPAV